MTPFLLLTNDFSVSLLCYFFRRMIINIMMAAAITATVLIAVLLDEDSVSPVTASAVAVASAAIGSTLTSVAVVMTFNCSGALTA